MPPSTPEQRFEVPPEYAEVYERAYRRAYEEGLGQLSSGEVADQAPRVRGRRGSRLSRASHRPMEQSRDDHWTQQWPGHEGRADATSQREPVPAVVGHPDEPGATRDRQGRRVERRRMRSSIAWALGMVVLALVLVPGSFVLGRLSVGRVDVPDVTAGAPPGGRAPAGAAPVVYAGAVETGLAGLQAAMEPPGPYRGALSRLVGARADATCAAPADRDARGRRVSYAPGNVLDNRLATAWLCKGSGVGQRLTITLTTTSDVVRVGLVPGYAKSDRYPQNNRITRVAWVFDDGTRVVQSLRDSRTNRSLRTLRIEPVRTRTVVLQILALARGTRDNTAISAVRLDTYAR